MIRHRRRGIATPVIVAHMPYGLRIIIETEYGAPAVKDAVERRGYEFNDSNIPMKSAVIAPGIPIRLGAARGRPSAAAICGCAPPYL